MKDLMIELEKEVRREEEDFRDLLNDFNFVKELNTELARRYQELMDCFPTASELDFCIEAVETGKTGYNVEMQKERTFKLRKFRSALVALEKQDVNVIPPKYEEIDR